MMNKVCYKVIKTSDCWSMVDLVRVLVGLQNPYQNYRSRQCNR